MLKPLYSQLQALQYVVYGADTDLPLDIYRM